MLKLFKIIPLLFILLSSSPDKYYRVVNTEYSLFDKVNLIVLQDLKDGSYDFLIDTINKRTYNINDTLQVQLVQSSDTIRTKRYFHFSDSKPNYDFFNYFEIKKKIHLSNVYASPPLYIVKNGDTLLYWEDGKLWGDIFFEEED